MILDPGSRVLDPGSRILDPGSLIHIAHDGDRGCLECVFRRPGKTLQKRPLQPISLSQRDPHRNSTPEPGPNALRYIMGTRFVKSFLAFANLGSNVQDPGSRI